MTEKKEIIEAVNVLATCLSNVLYFYGNGWLVIHAGYHSVWRKHEQNIRQTRMHSRRRVPSVAVAIVGGGGGVCPGCMCVCLGGCLPQCMLGYTPLNRITDNCENITSPQLRCGRRYEKKIKQGWKGKANKKPSNEWTSRPKWNGKVYFVNSRRNRLIEREPQIERNIIDVGKQAG